VLADERDALARELHRLKNGFYAECVAAGGISLRPGVREVIEAAAARGLRQGIVTTTSRANVDALLARHLGAGWVEGFAVVVCGEDVAAKKPSPECYRRALAALRLAPPAALAIEDSCSGAAAARGADVPVIVTRSAYFAGDIVDQAVAIGPGLHTRRGWQPAPAAPDDAAVTLDDLVDWHARMEWVGAHG
jgi:HAD superfamily hydrolase (TIGR01509 family)